MIKLLRDQVRFSKLMANALSHASLNKLGNCEDIIEQCKKKAVTCIEGQFDMGGDYYETDPCDYWLFGFADYSVLAIFKELIQGKEHYIAFLLLSDEYFDIYELRADMVEYQAGPQFILPESVLSLLTMMWIRACDERTSRLSAHVSMR